MGAGVRCGPACEETRGEGRRRDRALHWHRKKTGSEAPLGPGSLGSGGGGGARVPQQTKCQTTSLDAGRAKCSQRKPLTWGPHKLPPAARTPPLWPQLCRAQGAHPAPGPSATSPGTGRLTSSLHRFIGRSGYL